MSANLLSHFTELPDPRIERTKRYPLSEIIFLVISAVISGSDGWKAIHDFGQIKLNWLRGYLPYAQGIPTDDTIARVMRRLDTKAFESCFISWMQSVLIATEQDIVPIDGKTLRRSHDRSSGKSAIHMVSAWSSANGVVLGQEKTAEKSNEITAIPALLEVLALKGCIVTIDAMGCQEAIAEKIIQKQANYVLALKGNQGHFHEEVKEFFTLAFANHFAQIEHEFHEEHDAGHGRIEHRQCWVIDPYLYKSSFSNLGKWKKLSHIIMVKTQRDCGNRITHDTRFYIASTQLCAQRALHIVRVHWQVENCLHWTLDMTFNEDSSRIRTEASPENLAIMRHIALNIIKRDMFWSSKNGHFI
jgi:predicted transposase YbfD/YdcC